MRLKMINKILIFITLITLNAAQSWKVEDFENFFNKVNLPNPARGLFDFGSPQNNGWTDFIGSIFQFPFGSAFGNSDKCALKEGYSGKCLTSPTICQTMRETAKTTCVSTFGTVGQCCPANTPTKMILPPRLPQCGIRNLPRYQSLSDNNQTEKDYLIVGGTKAHPHSWPWLTSIMYKNPKTLNYSHICGGTIVNQLYIMSAGHCILSQDAKNFRIRIGATRLREGGDIYEVEKIIMHESYASTRHQNDISLMRLKRKINWSQNVAPVCLPTLDDLKTDLTGKRSWLIGWGTTSFRGKVSDDLLEVVVPIVTKLYCSQSYDSIFSMNDKISERQLCAGYDQGGKDTCQGDSGGPLMMETNGKIVQMGIVSYGNGCARPRFPGVYTNVAWFLPWIGLQMEKDFPNNS